MIMPYEISTDQFERLISTYDDTSEDSRTGDGTATTTGLVVTAGGGDSTAGAGRALVSAMTGGDTAGAGEDTGGAPILAFVVPSTGG
jgi:hypothetical protein